MRRTVMTIEALDIRFHDRIAYMAITYVTCFNASITDEPIAEPTNKEEMGQPIARATSNCSDFPDATLFFVLTIDTFILL